MVSTHRIMRALAVLSLLAACTGKKEIRAAKSSAYDADFAIVYSQTLDAVRDLYPSLDDNPATGTIHTAWHQVQFSNNADDPRQVQRQNQIGGDPNAMRPGGSIYKRHFIRFDVAVTGGRPWRVRVVARASEWEPGNALPTELRGAATPAWLPGRRDALIVSIYRRLRQYAIPVQEPKVAVVEDDTPAVDRAVFGEVPAAAAEAAAAIVTAVETRDAKALRAQLAADVVYSLGAAGDADTAMVLWQADAEALSTLGKVLRAGCRHDGATGAVTCPPDATETPGYVGWRAVLEERGGAWKLTAFVRGD
jgi:hypothetical protein